ncbi:MAG: hypothetical protein QOI41_5275, partial [Myxococcales bacterium]|nr:hypothetical protein [Myxococcales bacterium]
RDIARGEPSPKTRTLGEASVMPPSVGIGEHAGDMGAAPQPAGRGPR